MKNIIYFCLLLAGYSLHAQVQEPPLLLWDSTQFIINGDIYPDTDGGYTIFGHSMIFGTTVLKVDSQFNMLWWNSLLVNISNKASLRLADGNYVVAGERRPSTGGRKMSARKLAPDGRQIWAFEHPPRLSGLGSPRSEDVYDLIQTADGGFVIAGTGTGPGGDRLFLAKLDAEGNMLWSMRSDSMAIHQPKNIVELYNGDLMVLASNYPSPEFEHSSSLVRISPDGRILWRREVGWEEEAPKRMTMTSDGHLLSSLYTGGRIFLVKSDWEGNELWRYSYGQNPDDLTLGKPSYSITHLLSTPDHGVLLTASSKYTDGREYIYLLKVAGDGTRQWRKTLTEFHQSISWSRKTIRLPDGSYLGTCQNFTPNAGFPYLVIYKLGNDGTTGVERGQAASGLRVWPNPAWDNVLARFEPPAAAPLRWRLFDPAGRLLQQGAAPAAAEHEFELHTRGLAPGLYFLEVSAGTHSAVQKIVKL